MLCCFSSLPAMMEKETTKARSRENPNHATIFKANKKGGDEGSYYGHNREAEMCLQMGLSARAECACKQDVLPRSLDTALSLMVPCKRGNIPFL